MFLQEHNDIARFNHFHFVSRHARVAVIQTFAGDDIKLPTVPQAAQHAPLKRRFKFADCARAMRGLNRPFAQRRARVLTDVFDRVKFSGDVKNVNRKPIGFHNSFASDGNFTGRTDDDIFPAPRNRRLRRIGDFERVFERRFNFRVFRAETVVHAATVFGSTHVATSCAALISAFFSSSDGK